MKRPTELPQSSDVVELTEDVAPVSSDSIFRDSPGFPSSDIGLDALYDSDFINGSDSESEYRHAEQKDIPLDFDPADEPDYCFRMAGDVFCADGATIYNSGHLELLPLEQSIACPICSLFIGDVSEEARNEHVSKCIERSMVPEAPSPKRPKKEPKEPKLEKAKTTTHMNTSVAEVQKREIQPPKSLDSGGRPRTTIPDVKILSFPVTPVRNFSVSMDAFSFAPHDAIRHYFLSHFHSDHYGGISKKWCYTRLFDSVDEFEDESKFRPLIYCSEITGRLLTLKFNIDPRFIQPLKYDTRYLVHQFDSDDLIQTRESTGTIPGLYVTPMTANHCPGSFIFLFESIGTDVPTYRIVHCGDFRVCKEMITHPSLLPFNLPNPSLQIDKIYLDTTYLSFKYNFPKQQAVCDQAAQMFQDLSGEGDKSILSKWFGVTKQLRITDFLSSAKYKPKKKFLILVGTYLIGKERLAMAISKLLNCHIYVSNIGSRKDKPQVVQSFHDAYLDEVMVSDDTGAEGDQCVVHLVPMSIVSSFDELSKYFYHNKYFEVFERCIALRPTGWSFASKWDSRDDLSQLELSPKSAPTSFLKAIHEICSSQMSFTYQDDILTQKQKKNSAHEKDALRIYSLPYSEHSSYRELAFFCIFLNVKEVIPTVNLESEQEMAKMAQHIAYWEKCRQIKLGQYDNNNIDSEVYNSIRELCIEDF